MHADITIEPAELDYRIGTMYCDACRGQGERRVPAVDPPLTYEQLERPAGRHELPAVVTLRSFSTVFCESGYPFGDLKPVHMFCEMTNGDE